ncbi:MAG: hypothetical protein HPY65_16965 [Syntrophaceae bacterium]|nr:hypothetical protein [Syntrophaceae bacterium]
MIYKVIHIGANKSGSTTLQRKVFPYSSRLVYMGEDGEGYEDYRDIVNSLVTDDDIYFRFEQARALFDRFLSLAEGKTFLYSNEDIMTSRTPALCAQRLYRLMPDARILMVVRNQLTAIPSWYANHGAYLRHVPRCYFRRYVSFDSWMDYCTNFIRYSPIDGFFYHRIASLYASLFGRENVHVLLYEDFVHRREKFMKDLCRILRIDADDALRRLEGGRERRRNTDRELRYHRFRDGFFRCIPLSRYAPFGNALKRVWADYLEKGPPADGFMSDAWRKRIIELYRDDNSGLASEYGLPLRDHGYPMD